jgi:hypothetical protein
MLKAVQFTHAFTLAGVPPGGSVANVVDVIR